MSNVEENVTEPETKEEFVEEENGSRVGYEMDHTPVDIPNDDQFGCVMCEHSKDG